MFQMKTLITETEQKINKAKNAIFTSMLLPDRYTEQNGQVQDYSSRGRWLKIVNFLGECGMLFNNF